MIILTSENRSSQSLKLSHRGRRRRGLAVFSLNFGAFARTVPNPKLSSGHLGSGLLVVVTLNFELCVHEYRRQSLRAHRDVVRDATIPIREISSILPRRLSLLVRSFGAHARLRSRHSRRPRRACFFSRSASSSLVVVFSRAASSSGVSRASFRAVVPPRCRSTASGTIETDDRSRPVVYPPPGFPRAFRDRADARARASSRRDRVVDEGTARARQLDARTIVMLGARAMTSTSTVRVAADAGTARERGTMKIARAPGRRAMARGREDGRGARATRGARVGASAGGAKIKVIGWEAAVGTR